MTPLPSQTTSFLWRLAHELIPSENRLSQCNYGGFTSPFCKKACVGNVNATYTHIFFQCTHSKEVGDWLLNMVQVYSSTDATADSILDFRHLENDALSWITATTLHYIWEKRISTGGRASTGELLIQMKEKMKLMENTKFHNIFVIGSNMMVTAYKDKYILIIIKVYIYIFLRPEGTSAEAIGGEFSFLFFQLVTYFEAY